VTYKFLIFDTCHQDILYVCEQGCVDLWLFFEARRGRRAKTFGKHCPNARYEVFTAAKIRTVLQVMTPPVWCVSSGVSEEHTATYSVAVQ
jgi:hypothetical protein